jgi:hypothetical protein
VPDPADVNLDLEADDRWQHRCYSVLDAWIAH